MNSGVFGSEGKFRQELYEFWGLIFFNSKCGGIFVYMTGLRFAENNA